MKIHGIGVDIVKIGRIKKSLNNTKFKTRIFSIEEVNRCKKNVKQENCFAKKFAAKEAFSKALGTGISSGISFNEIVILNTKSGKPFIKLLGKTKKIVKFQDLIISNFLFYQVRSRILNFLSFGMGNNLIFLLHHLYNFDHTLTLQYFVHHLLIL